MPAGYSGTPLGKKLGFKPGEPLWASGMPASVRAVLEAQGAPRYLARPTKTLAAAHIFHTEAAKLAGELERLRGKLAPDGMVWVSWSKKAATRAS